jgi:GPH family glycoside/pentoside/hexuronide:cation symporter
VGIVSKNVMLRSLNLQQKLLYSCTSAGINLINTTVATWLLYFYAPPPNSGRPQYLSVSLVGVLLTIAQLWNAVIDPSIGYWSDVSRTQWGRRRPFMALGSLVTAVALLLLWTPPTAQSGLLNAIYFLLVTIAFYTGLSLVGVPYDGSLAEMATTPAEQVNLSMWKNVFGIIGVLCSAVIASVLYSRWGAIAMSVVMGAVWLASVGLSLLVLRDRILPVTQSLSFRQSIVITLQNRQFLILCVSTIVVQTAYAMLLSNLPYFVTLIVRQPEPTVGRFQGIVVVAMLIAAPMWNWLSQFYPNRRLLLVTMLGLATSSVLLAGVGVLPGVALQVQAAIALALIAPFLGGYFVLVYALMAAVVEYDEWLTQQRREAFHYSVFSLSAGIGVSLSSLVIAPIFSRYGYTVEQPLGVRVVFLAAAILVALGAVVFLGYRLGDTLSEMQ